jgi:mono/diheme cytochrome c family protein
MLRPTVSCISLLLLTSAFIAPQTFASDPSDAARTFLKNHCYDCHVGEDAEAGFDAATLSTDLAEHGALEKWVRVVDRVASGEMPPPDTGEISKEEQKRFLDPTSEWLGNYQRSQYATKGRVRGRRLTNLQLERTLQDLLGVDIPLASDLPDEPKTNGFTTVADGQPMSHFQLERHLGVVDTALDEAFRRSAMPDRNRTLELTPQQLSRRNPRRRTREPELRKGKAVVWMANTTYYGRLPSTQARRDGWFRFTLTASAINKPDGKGVWCSVRTGRCVSSAPSLTWVTGFEAQDEPKSWTFDAWLPEGHMLEIRPADATLKSGRFAGGQIGTGEGEGQDLSGLAMHSLKVERIHRKASNQEIRRRMFASLDVTADNVRSRDRTKIRVKSDTPKRDLRRLVSRFARHAFRRPVDDEAIAPFVQMAIRVFEEERSLVEALRVGYRSVLCSPRFVYLHEAPGTLDDYAIAARLSYFLWNTMPDKTLLTLAEESKLQDVATIRKQVERMLEDPRGQHFMKDFAHEWLELSEIDFTQLNRRRFPHFDPIVQNAMLAETHTFLETLLAEDLSVTNLVDSNFTFANSRLAAYYGIDGVTTDSIERVKLKPEHHRGGVLTHGAILKITANGTTTSPVERGVWVAERLLGQEIPAPPENIPAIEPDIRGATTIREKLFKHRADSSCASCHRKIDPPGFALENFDPSGQWRDRYARGRRRNGGPKVDASYTLEDGRAFNNVRDFQKLIVAKPANLARNLARKLMTYGTGAPVGFADRKQIDQIVQDAADSNYGLRSILHGVIASEAFRNK